MSFLDNLESSLKSLESREEREGASREDLERTRVESLAVAPWAEKLKNSAYVNTLLGEASLAGHRLRAKVYAAWMGTTLRLEAREHICEIYPTSGGVECRYRRLSDGLTHIDPVDLGSDPRKLLARWLDVR